MASDAVDSIVANENFVPSDATVARLCGARRGQWDVLSVSASRPLFRPLKCSGVLLVQENRRQFVHHVHSAPLSVYADASSSTCTGITSRSREVRPIASAHPHHVMCSALNYSHAKMCFPRQPTALRTRTRTRTRFYRKRWVHAQPSSSSTSNTRSSRTFALRASFSIRSLNTCGASSANASSLSGESPPAMQHLWALLILVLISLLARPPPCASHHLRIRTRKLFILQNRFVAHVKPILRRHCVISWMPVLLELLLYYFLSY